MAAAGFGEAIWADEAIMKMIQGQRNAGFTMIEILLAIAIFSGVVLVIYKSWEGILKSREIGERAAVEAQRMRVAQKTVEQALSSMVMFGENIPFYAFETDTGGDFAMMSFVARLPESFPGSGSFPGQPLRRVTFYVEQDRSRVNQLVLVQSPVLQILERDADPHTLVLAKDISQFQLAFWDAAMEEELDEWTLTNEVPKLVRASLGFGVSGRPGRARAAVAGEVSVAPPAMVIPREYQIPNNQQGVAGLAALDPRNIGVGNPNQPNVGVQVGGAGGQGGRTDARFSRGAGGNFYDGSRLNFGGAGAQNATAARIAAEQRAAGDALRYRRSNPYSRAFIDNLRNRDEEDN